MVYLRPGDEVICPDLTFASSWNVIEYVGAKPVFVDVDPETWCLDPVCLKNSINGKTKAVITVDLYGNSCDYSSIRKICKESNLFLIQDAAESLGSMYDNKNILSQGDISCTSFNLNKIITGSGGGAIFSKNNDLIKSAIHKINQCKVGNGYDYSDVGYNYRINALSAILVKSQLLRIDDILSAKETITNTYKAYLENNSNIKFQKKTEYSKHNNWLNVVKFISNSMRDEVHKRLTSHGFETKLPFTNATCVKWIKKSYDYKENKISKNLSQTLLALPSSINLDVEKIEKISKLIISEVKK